MHWSEDTYWTEALDRYQVRRDSGTRTITLDLDAIEQAVFNSDGPAYRLMHAMASVIEHEGMDGYRGAPRLVLAMLIQLSELPADERNLRKAD